MFDKISKRVALASDFERRGVVPKQKPHTSNQAYGTPLDFMSALEKKFGKMKWDLAATKKNAKAPRFITIEQDTFTVDWSKLKGNLFLNPPFGMIPKFAAYCAEMAAKGAHIFMLVPASVGARWFRESVWKRSHYWYLGDRIKFVGAVGTYPKDCMIIEYGGERVKGSHNIWKWRTNEVF